MPINLYDDRKVSLRRQHGNGDLDIIRASYTPCKANVTEALEVRQWAANNYHCYNYGTKMCFPGEAMFAFKRHLLHR